MRDKVLFGASAIQPNCHPPSRPKQEEKMRLSYGQVKERSAAVAAAMAAERSARNLASRRLAQDARDEREANKFRRRRKRKDAEDLTLLRQRLRVRMPQEERPRTGTSTARKLFHRTADMLFGTSGLTDARGPDGLYSIHFAFIARGFASTKGRRWRSGEAERAALYIVREEGLEGGERGWWSNIAADRNELSAFYRTSEAIERHDRSNANVYITEILALPHELSARQRRKAVHRICRFFDQRGLPYTVALHLPDRAGDQRNYHVHIIYSLRPSERHGPYDWSFAVGKEADINTREGIKARRLAVVQAINTTLCAAGIAKRYTNLTNKARGMAAGQAKIGQEATWIARRLEALEKRAERLRQLSAMVRSVRDILGGTGLTLQRQRLVAVERLRDLHYGVETASANDRTVDLEAVVRAHLSSRVSHTQDAIVAREKRVEAVTNQTVRAARREKLSEVRRLFLAATRSLQTNQTATDDQLRHIANRIRGNFSESSDRYLRFAVLGITAKKLEQAARLAERNAAIQQFTEVFGDAVADTRKAVATFMLTRSAAIERRTAAHVSRLANIRRTIERSAANDRLNALNTDLAGIMSNVDSRMLGAKQEVDIRLSRFGPDMQAAAARTPRLMLLGDVAQRRDREQQLSGIAGTIEQMIASADQRLIAFRRQAAALDTDVDRTDQPYDNIASHAAPAPRGEPRRDSNRRSAIAAAASQLRRAQFPPQVRTATGFAIAPGFEQIHRAADLFEAEGVIQKIHARKRAQMLAAVRRKVERTDRSPFIKRDGILRLPTDIFEPALRHAVSLSIKDQDFIELIDQLVLTWREREAAARKKHIEARARKELEATERRDRMQTGVEKVFRAIMVRINDGRYPKLAMAPIKDNILVVAKAVEEGRLMMLSSPDTRLYCATEGLRIIAGSVAEHPIGRQIIFALGKLTLDEPFDPAELPFSVALPRKTRTASSAEVGTDIFTAPGKGGAERAG